MGFIQQLMDEVVRQQGHEAGVKGEAPRIFFGDGGSHKKAYYEGYELGQKNAVNRALNKVFGDGGKK